MKRKMLPYRLQKKEGKSYADYIRDEVKKGHMTEEDCEDAIAQSQGRTLRFDQE